MKETERTSAGRTNLVTVCVGDQWFGMDMSRVQEIVKTLDITPVCLMPPHIAGIANLRGNIVTVIDLRCLLMGSTRQDDQNRYLIILQDGNERVGFMVEQVGDGIAWNDSTTFHPPANLMEQWRDVLVGIVQHKGQLIGVLDVDRVLQASMIQQP